MSVYNLMGPEGLVNETLELFKPVHGGTILEDVFPAKPGERDVNVLLDEDQIDAFIEWCEEKNLQVKLV